MYNSMQNLLLERLERFSGILIATSNLIDNLDHAFSRRFDLKLELKLPDKDLRIQLWRQLLPPELPLHREVDLCTLASRFALSGGQIETVIHNAAVAAAARKRNSRVVRQNDLETYAALEVETSFEEVATRRIGFGR
jgi:SpoVK/Ycf46/Vps4 family AAA+-type ATPase